MGEDGYRGRLERAARRERTDRLEMAVTGEGMARLQRTGEDGYRGRLEGGTRRERAARE